MQNQAFRGGSFAEDLSAVESRIEELRRSADGSDDRAAHLLDLESLHEELRVADEELRVQQEELERLLAAERDLRLQHQRLIAALPAPILVTDGAAVIRRVNQAGVDLLGSRREVLLGKPVPALVDPSDRQQLRTRIGEVRDGAEGFCMAITLRASRGPSPRVDAVVQAAAEDGSRTMTWLLVPQLSREEGGTRGPRLADAFAELARLPLGGAGKREVLTSVATVCGHAFGRGAAVSVALGDPCQPDYISSDGRLAQDLDGAQMISAEGPCQTAWEQGRLVLSPDLRHDGRWPKLAARIADREVGGVIAVPVLRADKPVGVLNVYAEPGRRLGTADERVAQLMAGTVGAILHEVEQKAELAKLADQLQEALHSRAVIDQAKGMIMAQEGCDADAAFQRLVQLSSHANVKLRVVAQRLVDSAASR